MRQNERYFAAVLPVNDPNSENRRRVAQANLGGYQMDAFEEKAYRNKIGKLKTDKSEIYEGLDFVARVMDNTPVGDVPFDQIKVMGNRTKRSFFTKNVGGRSGVIADDDELSGKEHVETVAHECGHNIEHFLRSLSNEVNIFLTEITTKENGERTELKKFGKPYRDDEEYYVPRIRMPREYCTKNYNGTSTELTSMFVQLLTRDPARLIKDYPEFYDGMVGCLNRARNRK